MKSLLAPASPARKVPADVAPWMASADPAPETDRLDVMVLRSMMLFGSCRRYAECLGAELFRDPLVRQAAASIVVGRSPLPATKEQIQARLWLAREVAGCTVPGPDDPSWGIHLIRQLAERRHQPMLVATLHWAAEEVQARDLPLAFILRRVIQAFAVAMGCRGFDRSQLLPAERRWA